MNDTKRSGAQARRVDVILNPAEYAALAGRDLSDTTCVVFDILRATTTMLTAFANGAAEIIPVSEIPEALALRAKDATLLLAGERGGHRIRADLTGSVDFDFGNSPREFTPEKVHGRRIAITTTNGTRALRACAHAAEVQIGAFLNLKAVAAALRASTMLNILLVCAGTADESSMEDTLAAGALYDLLAGAEGLAGEVSWTDAANVAHATYLHHAKDLMGAMAKARNGRKLLSQAELAGDVEVCLRRETLGITARMANGILKCG